MTATRREFLESTTAAVAALGAAAKGGIMIQDGPASPNFSPVPLKGNTAFEELGRAGLSGAMTTALAEAPRGASVAWGIPFRIDRPILLKDLPVTEQAAGLKAE